MGINDLLENNADLTDSTQISTCSWTKGLSAVIELNMHTLLRQTSVHAIAETLLLLKLISFFYISPSYGMLLKTTQWCLFHHTEATLNFFLSATFVLPQTIPLPFIAVAADLMNMQVIHTLLRNSGAFYMRRSFMSDPLYWVVFTEYIQNQLQYGDQPLEFFLEGTQSRTGKFLQPKLGMYIEYC